MAEENLLACNVYCQLQLLCHVLGMISP